MKKTFSVFVLFLPVLLFAQKDFTVDPGTTKTLTSTERTISVRTFTLGDNCTIIIPATMDGWTVTATDATIGSNVKIIGLGVNGNSGANGNYGAAAANCMTGGFGGNGMYGVNAGNGKNVTLNLKIRSIGTITIDVKGGRGGNGGAGGNGGKGGNATCTCNAGAGGNGGSGGRGGNGGNGGNVTISYSKFGNADVSNSNFVVVNTMGAGGAGGSGGIGGQGGAGGGCSDPKSAIRPAGAMGKNATGGASGIQGKNGVTTIKAL